jgi:hypothetical protein
MLSKKQIEDFRVWSEKNSQYLLSGRPSRGTLLKKLKKEGFKLNLEQLGFLIKETKPFSKKDKIHNIDEVSVTGHSLITKDFTPKKAWYNGKEWCASLENINYFKPEDIDFDKVLENVKPFVFDKKYLSEKYLTSNFDRLVFTDVHVGMSTGDEKESLYDLKWNKKELFDRLDKMIAWTLLYQKSDTLIINELGDFLDGYEGYTTRGGHKLPQNMSTQDCFDAGLEFKIKLIQSLIPYFKKIIMINVCQDNHSGAFGYILNSAFKKYCEIAFDNVEIINQRKFLDSYIFDKHCFVLTHGKDDKNMKFGLKPKADANTVNKLTSYLKNKELLIKPYQIEISKGDSHLYLFDSASSDLFEYNNYPAFSPSSHWVELNFNRGRSGFVHYNYTNHSKNINTYLF